MGLNQEIIEELYKTSELELFKKMATLTGFDKSK